MLVTEKRGWRVECSAETSSNSEGHQVMNAYLDWQSQYQIGSYATDKRGGEFGDGLDCLPPQKDPKRRKEFCNSPRSHRDLNQGDFWSYI